MKRAENISSDYGSKKVACGHSDLSTTLAFLKVRSRARNAAANR